MEEHLSLDCRRPGAAGLRLGRSQPFRLCAAVARSAPQRAQRSAVSLRCTPAHHPCDPHHIDERCAPMHGYARKSCVLVGVPCAVAQLQLLLLRSASGCAHNICFRLDGLYTYSTIITNLAVV